MIKKLALVVALIGASLPAYAADTIVTQSHTTFDVEDVTINKGDTITFANKDDVTHNIQAIDSSGNNVDKGLQKPGEDIKVTFDKPGDYKIHCAIHPKMKMDVSVK